MWTQDSLPSQQLTYWHPGSGRGDKWAANVALSGKNGGCLHQDEKAKLGYEQESSSGLEKYRNKQQQCALQLAILVAGESLGGRMGESQVTAYLIMARICALAKQWNGKA